jgi:L-threonylcarbamoyladenylate synthase
MKRTLVLKVDPQKPETESVRIAAGLIKNGGLVAFPTETVYGLGADALNANAVLALFEAKKRPLDNPPIVHVCSVDDVRRLARTVPPLAKRLVKRFWPGPLTLIVLRSKIVPDATVAGLDTIAVRMPDHRVALALIRESCCPIAAPSANLAGRPSPTSAEHVLEDLDGRIDAVLDAGATQVGVESTVLDLTVDPPQVLRPGGTPFEELEKALGRVELSPAAVADRAVEIEKASSPGVRHRHYAPRAEMVVVEGEADAVVDRVKELVKSQMAKSRKIAVLCSDETMNRYKAYVVRSLGSRSDLAKVARSLFRLLREVDSEGVDLIVAEGFPTSGLGLAIMNRLRKASGYNIVKAEQKHS